MLRHELITQTIVVSFLLLVPMTAHAGLYSDAVLNDNPIAYWRLGDVGGAVADSSGNSNNGASDGPSVSFGNASLVPAEPGDTSVALAGSDRIIIPGFEKIGPTGYSAEYWVKVTQYPAACCDSLVSDGESGGDFFMMNYLIGPGQGDDGAVRPHYSFGNTPVSLTTTPPNILALDQVHHVVTTWDAADPDNNNGKIYIDGVLALEGNVTGNVPLPGTTGDNIIYIGRDGRENRPSNFEIDEVALYDFPLTSQQVSTHYNIGIVPEPGTSTMALIGMVSLMGLAGRRRLRRALTWV